MDSKPKNKVGRPQLSIKKNNNQDPNSIHSPSKEGGGGKDPQNLNDRLNDSSIIEETGANAPPANYKSNLGGYDNQFDSDDDDDFSDQGQVQRFRDNSSDYDRGYNKMPGQIKDDEVMVDDNGMMHSGQ